MTALATAIAHTLWQGILIGLLLAAILKAFAGTAAKVRYNLSTASLVVLFVMFCITFAQKMNSFSSQTSMVTTSYNTAYLQTKVSNAGKVVSPNAHWDVFQLSERYSREIFGLYLLGLLFMAVRLGLELYKVESLRRSKTLYYSEKWQASLQQLQVKLSVWRKIEVFFSPDVQVPLMLGVLKPIILVPLSALSQLPPLELETILLHELAHIKRNDYLVNLLQHTIEMVLFFNPADLCVA
jgi:beta-lactamase regulating signal transducer with metallopeptidase domain